MGGYPAKVMVLSGLVLGSVGFSSWAHAQGADVMTATASQKQQAQKLFLAAMNQYTAKRFDEAYAGFKASYDVVASPNSHLMMARCLRDGGKTLQAYREFEAVVTEAAAAAARDAKYKESEQAARTESRALRAQLALVTLRITGAPPNTRITLADQSVDITQLNDPIPVLPGKVSVVVSAPGKTDVRRDLMLSGGSEEVVSIDLAKEWTPQPVAAPAPAPVQAHASGNVMGLSKRQWAYVAGGVGAAGVLTFGVFGLMNNAKYGDLQDSCPNGHCPPDRSDDIDAGKRYQTIANIGLVVGVVGLGTGTTLYLMSRKSQNAPESGTSTVPEVAVGPGSVTVRGQF